MTEPLCRVSFPLQSDPTPAAGKQCRLLGYTAFRPLEKQQGLTDTIEGGLLYYILVNTRWDDQQIFQSTGGKSREVCTECVKSRAAAV